MTELPLPEFYAAVYRRHGHRCPMSTLGGRLGWSARRRLGAGTRASLEAVFYHDTCAVDGIAVATGCSVAAGSLAIRPRGRHLLQLRDPSRDGEILLALTPAALEIAAPYRALDEELAAGRGQLEPREIDRLEAARGRVLQEVLTRLWTLPDEVLLTPGDAP